MIKVKCFECCDELTELGALLFSPPNENSQVDKFHVCTRCYRDKYHEVRGKK